MKSMSINEFQIMHSKLVHVSAKDTREWEKCSYFQIYKPVISHLKTEMKGKTFAFDVLTTGTCVSLQSLRFLYIGKPLGGEGGHKYD